jgi:hypothetical protein
MGIDLITREIFTGRHIFVLDVSASKVYSGPLMPAFREVLPNVTPIERRNMNLWEDDVVRDAITATGKRTLAIQRMRA